MKINLHRYKWNVLTNYNVAFFFINIYNANIYNLYAINTCLSWIILITFDSTILLDNTSFERIIKKNNFNYLEFHIGNFVLHKLPCIYMYYYPPVTIEYKHTIVALNLLIMWCYIVTKGTMDLSDIYIKYDWKIYKRLYFISILTGLSIPLVYNNYKNLIY
tara:strand:- start:1383 stop:1865 length:483 start_codon:yes stop_codon:yes gene_type:complete